MTFSESTKTQRLAIIMLAGFVLVTLNLFRMQVVRGDYYRSLSEKNRIRVIYLEAPRGRILDRNGVPLATSRLSFNCSVFPRETRKRMDQSLEVVASTLGVDAADLKKSVSRKKPGVYNTVLVAEDISRTQAMALEEKLDSLPGFTVETRPVREYPYGEASAHLLGYIGPMTEDEIEELEPYDYRPSDWLGRAGIEKSYEAYLRGFSGGLQVETNNRGRFLRALGVKEPKEGKDIQLTVDARLQAFVQGLLSSQRGAIVVMDTRSGEVLSMNSSPSFEPNLFSSRKGRRDVGRYLQGEGSPMVSRAVRGKYPPGSIFKIVTALAALEKGKITQFTTFNCPGHVLIGGNMFRCWKEGGHGPQNMTQAFAHSCNVYFIHAALAAGPDAVFRKAVELGMNQLTGIDLPGEKPGFVPSREWKRSTKHLPWYDGETANLSIGQGYLQVTPVQAAVMIAAAATGGRLVRPHLVQEIGGTKVAGGSSRFAIIPERHWNIVRQGLHEVVNSGSGTGRLARQPDFLVAGKTGTAQSGQDKTHAWFVGFAPEKDPKIAMVVFLEHGGRGGVSAATMAGKIFHWLGGAGYL